MKLALWILAALPLLAGDDRLMDEVSRLAKITDGVVGVSAIHIESGRRFSFHGKDRFPMASSVKVPIAVQLLAKIDRNELQLSDMYTLTRRDLHPGSGTLSALFNKPGVSLSVRNLMELMLLISDNSATDIILKMAGGGNAVTGKMRELGIEGINVDRPTIRLISDWIGAELPPEAEWRADLYKNLYAAVPEDRRTAANVTFNQDIRDTAEPDAMADLLQRIWLHKLHKPASAELLVDIMSRCQTGDPRIKGMLPRETPVPHKTGSIGGTVNDVGIVTLPGDAGHVVIALFVKKGSKSDISEKAIAQISRTIYDYYLYSK